MASLSSSFMSLADALVEGPLGVLAQELLVLGVFFVSFAAWRHLRPLKGHGRIARQIAKAPVAECRRPAAVEACSDTCSAEGLRLRQVQQPVDRVAAQQTQQQLLKHLEHREFTRALNMYRSLERDGRDRHFSEELYSAFIQSAVRVGKLDVVERMLRSMRRSSVTPSLAFWQTTLKMLSSRKHFGLCLSIHALFGKAIPSDKVAFSCLINAALEINAPERAIAMLQQYSMSDIDIKDHVLFFRTYVALNDVDKAEALFRKLGSQATNLMLNLLLLTCVNTQQPNRCCDLLKEAHALEKSDGERIVDVVSYNTVIKGFAQANMPTRSFECLREMARYGLEPDDITFGTLLDVCIVENDMGAAHEIVNLLLGSERTMDTVMCTLFIKGLVKANCLPKAMELYGEMKRRDSAHPDIVTYSVLIKALVDQHELTKALKLVEDMGEAGLSPDDIILTHLLEGCRHAGNHTLGKQLFTDMLAAGVVPSEFTLVTMLKLHGRCGAHKEAYDLVVEWEDKHGMKPSVIHYTCLISGCLRTKNYDQAWAAYELMSSKGVLPDATAISTLLPGMVASQQWDRVLSITRTALQGASPIGIPSETLNNALSQLRMASGCLKQAVQLQQIMQRAGVPIHMRNSKRHS